MDLRAKGSLSAADEIGMHVCRVTTCARLAVCVAANLTTGM
jgi:hypothetical protein